MADQEECVRVVAMLEEGRRKDGSAPQRSVANPRQPRVPTTGWATCASRAARLLGPAAEDLANNNLAATQVFILQGPRRKPPGSAASCKQQLSGLNEALA